MTPKNEWSPAQGPAAAPEQVPTPPPRISGAGDDGRTDALWAPSQGPAASEPGGPGGEPSGHAIPPPAPTALDEG